MNQLHKEVVCLSKIDLPLAEAVSNAWNVLVEARTKKKRKRKNYLPVIWNPIGPFFGISAESQGDSSDGGE